MKKILTLIIVAGMMTFISCGPSAKEKAEKDSIAKVEKAEKAKQDSVAKAESIKKNILGTFESKHFGSFPYSYTVTFKEDGTLELHNPWNHSLATGNYTIKGSTIKSTVEYALGNTQDLEYTVIDENSLSTEYSMSRGILNKKK